ncbi:MAG: transposase [Nibricoccus sp.]
MPTPPGREAVMRPKPSDVPVRGLTSKIHLLTDALGYPVRFVVTGGERNDITQAPALLPAGTAAAVLCDCGYNADWWRERIVCAGHQPVDPGRRIGWLNLCTTLTPTKPGT